MTAKAVEVRNAWSALFPNAAPADSQFALWLMMHSEDVVREGLVQLATKRRKLNGEMDLDYMVRFASAVMSRLSRERLQRSEERTSDKRTTI